MGSKNKVTSLSAIPEAVFTSQNLLDDSMEEKGTVSDLDS
jgi:hypothetical protein